MEVSELAHTSLKETTSGKDGAAQRPSVQRSSASNPNMASLPPLVTSPPSRSANLRRENSNSSKRLSAISNASGRLARSRPQSTAFPLFPSTLPYALVRDFAYPINHKLHYGAPLDEPSGDSTPASETQRRLSDPPEPWKPNRSASWGADPGGGAQNETFTNLRLPSRAFGDGPPYREDDDLLSPIVTSTKHRRSRSVMEDYFRSRGSASSQTKFAGTNDDGTHLYYVGEVGETANGPGGEYITYPPNHQGKRSNSVSKQPPTLDTENLSQRFTNSSFGQDTQRGQAAIYNGEDDDLPPQTYSPTDDDPSRYSRDYQFTIASPDEEMHGKAVALYDFASEHPNELPLDEGQVIWVSYRHGQGWLVAQDPRSGEKGLVPETYVRLVRDIEGGLNGLAEITADDDGAVLDTPTVENSVEHTRSNSSSQRYTPVVSHFSTSSRDLEKYPSHHLLGSQANTPIAAPGEGERDIGKSRLGSVDEDNEAMDDH